MIGRRLAHYEVLAKLGEGGMGEVFRATDTKLGREVALKMLPADVSHDPARLARFQREARAVAALNHPNIVTLYSVEDAGAVHFLTMELVDGQPLAERIPEHGLPIDQILMIGASLAEALTAAHDRGIVHRDLKPANVMLTRDGRVKVLDFGLAKEIGATDREEETIAASGKTQVGAVMGTPAYMSPEQLAGRSLDHRTDIFSLGILLYEMCSGKRPFHGKTSMELASAILRDTPPPLERADLPTELTRLIRRCLEKDVQRRVQTARDIGNELREMGVRPERSAAPVTARMPVADAARTKDSGSHRADEGFWVAVLPFKYRGTNADVEALADGLTEEIVTGLSRFSYLRVIARGSVSRYAEAPGDVRVIAKEIGARYVMEGTVRQAGSQLRVAVQLVDAAAGTNLWAETFDRPFQSEALFELQDMLVARIVSTVADTNGVLPRSMADALRSRNPADLTPYEAVLRVCGFYARIAPDEHAELRVILERAVERAPDYADAWAFLSLLYLDEYRQGYNPRPDPLDRALAAARRAVDLSTANHFTHYALASVLFFKRDLVAFRRTGERAIDLNPTDANCVALLGCLIAYSGDWERGIALVEQSIALNPHHPGWFWLPLAHNAYRQYDYAGALDAAVKCNMPGYFFASVVVVETLGQLGGREAARDALQHLLRLKPDVASTIRADTSKWFVEPAYVDHLMEGLRKAGLDVE